MRERRSRGEIVTFREDNSLSRGAARCVRAKICHLTLTRGNTWVTCVNRPSSSFTRQFALRRARIECARFDRFEDISRGVVFDAGSTAHTVPFETQPFEERANIFYLFIFHFLDIFSQCMCGKLKYPYLEAETIKMVLVRGTFTLAAAVACSRVTFPMTTTTTTMTAGNETRLQPRTIPRAHRRRRLAAFDVTGFLIFLLSTLGYYPIRSLSS